MDPSLLFGIVICLLFSAFFSSAETALVSLPAATVQTLRKEGKVKGIILWEKQPTQMLITILIGNNIANIAAASFATLLAQNIFKNASTAIAIGTTTLVLLLVGEIFPKSLARRHAILIVSFIMPLLVFFYFLFYPFAFFFSLLLFLQKEEELKEIYSEKDLIHVIEKAVQGRILSEDHGDILLSSLRIRDIQAREIMVPRLKVTLLNRDTSPEEIKKIIRETGHSRFPVFQNNPDNIIGILHAKDFILLDKHNPLDRILQPVHFIPENKRIYDLLQSMQVERYHMGVVVDEFGSFVGIITLEDILEEIVGEIADEHDLAKSAGTIKVEEGGQFIFDASTPIHVVNRYLKTELPLTGDYETLGGFLTAQWGDIPPVGEICTWDQWHFKVESATEKKVLMVRAIPIRDGEEVSSKSSEDQDR